MTAATFHDKRIYHLQHIFRKTIYLLYLTKQETRQFTFVETGEYFFIVTFLDIQLIGQWTVTVTGTQFSLHFDTIYVI